MDFFTLYIYQPFFNILVGIYWMVGQLFGQPDMGIAVILFAVAVRLILLPIDLVGERSDEEKFQISQKVKRVRQEFSDDPVRLKEEIRRVMRQSPGAILSEVLSVTIQIIIILMLYRIFTTGLEGEDLHLLYPFMPKIAQPINLMFLGLYDLSHTNSTLNLLQSVMIALSEFVHLHFAPVKPNRKDFVSLVIILPVVSFVVFMLLPAGKKVFIITSLGFGIVVRVVKHILYLTYSVRREAEVPAQPVTGTPGTEPTSQLPPPPTSTPPNP